MKTINVSKQELLKAIKLNAEKHQDEYNEARSGYLKAVVRELEDWLQEVRDGKHSKRVLQAVSPENHVPDYQRAIGMLEMSTDNTIELNEYEYAQYVQDEWA